MRLLSRIPMVYSSKIFDERIAGKLQIKVSAKTRKPENQKPEPEPEAAGEATRVAPRPPPLDRLTRGERRVDLGGHRPGD